MRLTLTRSNLCLSHLPSKSCDMGNYDRIWLPNTSLLQGTGYRVLHLASYKQVSPTRELLIARLRRSKIPPVSSGVQFPSCEVIQTPTLASLPAKAHVNIPSNTGPVSMVCGGQRRHCSNCLPKPHFILLGISLTIRADCCLQ